MKKIIIWIIAIFLLTSCYSNSDEKKKIQKNDLVEKEFIFEKNKECFELNDKAKEKRGKDFIDCWTVKIIDWFYSSSLNSCIHWMRTEIVDCSTSENKYWEYFLTIKDFYSTKNIITFPCTVWLDDWCDSDYENKIKELKK